MGTYTTNYNLFMPTIGEQGWGELVNNNFSTIDTTMAGLNARIGTLETETDAVDERVTALEAGEFEGNVNISGAVNCSKINALTPHVIGSDDFISNFIVSSTATLGSCYRSSSSSGTTSFNKTYTYKSALPDAPVTFTLSAHNGGYDSGTATVILKINGTTVDTLSYSKGSTTSSKTYTTTLTNGDIINASASTATYAGNSASVKMGMSYYLINDSV